MTSIETSRKTLQNCISKLYRWCDSTRSQQISYSDMYFARTVIPAIEQVMALPEIQGVPGVAEQFSRLLDAYEERDYILAVDYMESGILPCLEASVEDLVRQLPPPITESAYQVEYTASGACTLAKIVNGKRRYLHTNLCPTREAERYAERWQSQGKTVYYIAGLAFGYHIEALSRNTFVKVYVYEEDRHVIELAEQYSDVWEILNTRTNVEVIWDSGYREFAEKAYQIDQGTLIGKACIYFPSIYTIFEDSLRDKMELVFLQMDNADRWAGRMRANFDYNQKHISNGVEELRERICGKTVYLIAGGPSLDKNIHLLRERDENSLVLTVGASLWRCVKEGIEPEFVIITDPSELCHWQIKGYESCGIPLILLSTAYARLTEDYNGEKYIACQKGYLPAEKLADEKGWITVETGSSVTTTAIDICIRFEAARVVFLGLDLAFTGGRSHQGLSCSNITGKSELQVPDIFGSMVPTSKNLNSYRRWIEDRIKRAKTDNCRTEFIDASEGGARIAGTQVMKLIDVMQGGMVENEFNE